LKVIWSPLALGKLEESAKFIALDKQSAAKKWVNDIFDHVEMLCSQPEMGREVPELSDSRYREIVFGSYRIIYKIENDIKVLTIRNSRQLLSSDDVEL